MHAWPSGRSLHGGVDEIPLPEGPGRLWLSGKHFVGVDPSTAMVECGAGRLVCLCERHELVARYPDYVSWLEAQVPEAATWWPIPDLHAPGLKEADALLDALRRMIGEGETILLHCGAGIGRAGTIAAGLLIRMGLDLGDSLAVVSRARPMAGPEVGEQTVLLERLAQG